MEFFRKVLAQKVFNTRPKTEQHRLNVMDKSIHEENLFQPLQTNNKQFKAAITFLTGYIRFFNVANKKKQVFVHKIK